VQEVPQFDEELIDVDALGDDQADVERGLEPAAGEDGFFEEGLETGVFVGHGGRRR
jgi:hypothetical protein